MARGLVPFDRSLLGEAGSLTGIDEAGRGCLAGPVVAAAVRCRRDFYLSPRSRVLCRGVNDSKQLTPEQRAAIVVRFRDSSHENWLQIAVASASVGEIGRHNIYQATVLAMRRAFEALNARDGGASGWWQPVAAATNDPVLIDGKPIRTFPHAHRGIVGGDARSFAIALAGIHAKEARDAMMRELDREHPGYGFSEHKGYGTPAHLAALRERGPSPVHRALFVRNCLLGREIDPATLEQDSLF